MGDKCSLLLIDPVTECWKSPSRFDNISLGYLASYARHMGFSTRLVSLLDYNSPERLQILLRETQPSLIGITALTNSINYVLELTRILKKFSSTPIVLGGPHVSSYTSEFLKKNPQVDFVIKWEGELKLVKLLSFLIKGEGTLDSIPGLMYKKDGRIFEAPGILSAKNLDIFPFPERASNSAITPFCCSRGCKQACKYCLFSKSTGPGIRWRSAKNIVNEFKEIRESRKLRQVYFVDSTMNDEPEKFIEVCKLLTKAGIRLPKNSQIYLKIEEKFNADMVRWAKRAGINNFFIGVESGSRRLRQLVNKHFSEQAIFETVEGCLAMGVVPETSVMIGIPGENWGTIFETFHLLTRLNKIGCIEPIFAFKPYPGTVFFDDTRSYDLSIVENNFDYWTDEYMVVRTKALSESQLASITWVMRFIPRWFNNRYPQAGGLRKFVLNHIPQPIWDIIFFSGVHFHMLAKVILGLKRSKINLGNTFGYPPSILWRSFMKGGHKLRVYILQGNSI